MKEAAGEANLTVIAVVLIGVVMMIALPLIQSMMVNTAKRSCCTNAGGTWNGGCQNINTPYWDEANNKCL